MSVAELVEAYRANPSRETRQALAAALRRRPRQAVELGLEDLVAEGLSWPDVDPQDLFPAAAALMLQEREAIHGRLGLLILNRCLLADPRLERLPVEGSSPEWQAALARQAELQGWGRREPVAVAGGRPESEAVRRHYEEHPYPPWTVLAHPPVQRGHARIAVVGAGTGREPLSWALARPDAEVLAVDLSAASLAYAQGQAAELGVSNVRWLRADLLDLGDYPERFDLVVCSGVLHHLEDPDAGMRVVAGLVRPGGHLQVALYSGVARAGLRRARELLHDLTFADVRAARARLLALPDDDPARQAVVRTTDFYSASGCRDLLFHPCERHFCPSEVGELLAGHGLVPVRVLLPEAQLRRYETLFPDDLGMVNLDLWDTYERLYPNTFFEQIHLLARKGQL